MLVGKIVNLNSQKISISKTVREAAEILKVSQASDLMVVDDLGKFVGVLSEGDLLRACLPKLEELIEAGSLTAAGELFSDHAAEISNQSIEPYVLKHVITLKPTDHVNNAAGIMISKMIRRLPVVQDGNLIGTVSRADIASAVLS